MSFLQKITFYKGVNIALFASILCVLVYMYINYGKWCVGMEDSCYYDFYEAIYNPLYAGGKVLVVILGALLFVPAHIFKKWLFFIAPIIILVTINRVLAVSVYSSSIGSIDKIHMAQLGMYFLGIVTVVFVVACLYYDKRKKLVDNS